MVRSIALLAVFGSLAWTQNLPVREALSASIMGPMPGFYNGYLYQCQPDDMVTLFAPSGEGILTVPIQGGGDSRVEVMSVAIDDDGTLAISRVGLPKIGIDIRDSSGNLIRSIDTGRYMPAQLSFGQDHSLWSFGWQRDATRPEIADRQDYATVRKYLASGKQVGAYLPRSLFPAGLEPGEAGWQQRRITVTSDRVGIHAYSGNLGSQKEWVELDLNGNLTGRWRLDQSDEFRGVALTSDGQAYVQRSDPKKKSRSVFRLNRATSEWEPVNSPDLELYGSDGDKLVFATWPDGLMHLSWFPQPDAARSTANNSH